MLREHLIRDFKFSDDKTESQKLGTLSKIQEKPLDMLIS